MYIASKESLLIRINVFKLLACFLALTSLFLPWISFTAIRVWDYSDLSVSSTIVVTTSWAPYSNQGTIHIRQFNNGTVNIMSSCNFDLDWVNTPVLSELGYGAIPLSLKIFKEGWTELHIGLASISSYCYLFSVCFIVVGLSTTRNWNKTTKWIITIMCATFIGSASMLLISELGRSSFTFHKTLEDWSQVDTATYRTVLSLKSDLIGIGFYLAFISAVLIFFSYTNPKFITLPIDFGEGRLSKARHALVLSEREKPIVIFLTTILASWLLSLTLFITSGAFI